MKSKEKMYQIRRTIVEVYNVSAPNKIEAYKRAENPAKILLIKEVCKQLTPQTTNNG